MKKSRISAVTVNVRLREKTPVFFSVPKDADLRLLLFAGSFPGNKMGVSVDVHNRGKKTVAIWDGLPFLHLAVQSNGPMEECIA